MHYVIQGVSATIQKISLDKDYYNKGDVAQVVFSWTPSADSFPESRLGKGSEMPDVYFSGSVVNKEGYSCIEPVKQLLSERYTMNVNLSLPIIENCIDPEFSISLVDPEGNILDQKTIKAETNTYEKKQSPLFFAIIIILILIIFLSFVFFKKNKRVFNVTLWVILFFIISLGIIIPKTEVSAMYTLEIKSDDGWGGITSDPSAGNTGTPPAGLSMTLGFSNSTIIDGNHTYAPNANIIVETSVYYNACDNSTRRISVDGYISGPSYTGSTKNMYNGLITGTTTLPQTSYFHPGPSAPGNYILNVKISGYYLDSYLLTDKMGGYNISEYDWNSFKSQFIEKMCTYETTMVCEWAQNSIPRLQGGQYGIDELNYGLGDFDLTHKYVASTESGALEYERNYDIAFKVIGSTIDVQIMNDNGVYINETVTKSVGSNVLIRWSSTDALACRCRCVNPDNEAEEISCGSPPLNPNDVSDCGTDKNKSFLTIYNLVKSIKFKVTCDP